MQVVSVTEANIGKLSKGFQVALPETHVAKKCHDKAVAVNEFSMCMDLVFT